MTTHTDIYRLLFNEARDGIWIINPANRKVLEVNRELTVLSGYTRDELLSMPPQNISPDPEGTMQIMKKAMQEGGEIFAERLLKKRTGPSYRFKSRPVLPPLGASVLFSASSGTSVSGKKRNRKKPNSSKNLKKP